MLSLTVTDRTAPFIERLRAAAAAGIPAAAQVVCDESIGLVSRPAPPASQRGNPPKLRTGESIEVIRVETSLGADGPEARVGALEDDDFNALAYWETHGRPWLKPTFEGTTKDQAQAFADAASQAIAAK